MEPESNSANARLARNLIAELAPVIPTLALDSAEACAVRYAYGRSHFKINSVTKASRARCQKLERIAGIKRYVGAKAWYLIGKSYERKKMWKEAAKASKDSRDAPAHSMADDGYALAGIGYQEAGDLVSALSLWEQQVKHFQKVIWLGKDTILVNLFLQEIQAPPYNGLRGTAGRS